MFNKLIYDCLDFVKGSGLEFAFCGGHALDICLEKNTRPHGDIDISMFWEDRNKAIEFMWAAGWTVYEACGGGMVHLIKDIDRQRLIKRNIFCVRDNCPFFHVKAVEDRGEVDYAGNDMYQCDIDHVEQTELNYIEILFNRCDEGKFIYSRNNDIRLDQNKALLMKDDIPYLAPELVLLYKSTDTARAENRRDFDNAAHFLTAEGRLWLIDALSLAFPGGHEWVEKLKERVELWDILDEHGNRTGRFHERGKPMGKGEYHLVVLVWIMNRNKEFLISKRTPGIGWGSLWQQTGGSAVAGDDSLKSALKETKEELGIELEPENGQLFKQYKMPHTNDDGGVIYNVWLFKQDIDISTIVFQPEETCGAMWATKEKINQMFDEGTFIPREFYPYLDELFSFCEKMS